MQQTLATSFKCHTIRRRTRIGSHNLEWLSVDGEDLVDLLVESVMKNSDLYMLFTFRKISRAFRSMVNAKLDKLLAEFRALADASRLEVTQLADTHPMPDGWWDIRDWIKGTDAIRLSKPTHFKAYAAYKNLLDNWFSPAIADPCQFQSYDWVLVASRRIARVAPRGVRQVPRRAQNVGHRQYF